MGIKTVIIKNFKNNYKYNKNYHRCKILCLGIFFSGKYNKYNKI